MTGCVKKKILQGDCSQSTAGISLSFSAQAGIVFYTTGVIYFISYKANMDEVLEEMENIKESNAYESFASVYDTLMDNVPYEEWGAYLHGLLEEYGITEGLVVDLGCGTGTMTEYLAERGYDMIGVDNSGDMLAIAMEKKIESGHDILYLMQDMRELDLYGSARAIVSICDSVNYITEPEELCEVFRRTGRFLDEDGVFIFDFNTDYKYREIIGEQTIAEDREDCSFIWENYYYEEEQINEYGLSLFIRDEELSGEADDIFRRYQETHYQRGYTLREMEELIRAAGMKLVKAYDAFTRDEPTEKSERIYMIVKKGEES